MQVPIMKFTNCNLILGLVRQFITVHSNQKIPETFKNFLIKNIDSINEEKEFRAFMLHFEAVVGFFYGIEGVKSN